MSEETFTIEFEPIRSEDLSLRPQSGYIYYDGASGALQSVTMRLDPDSPNPYIEVPAPDVLQFLEGNQLLSNWLVTFGHDRKTMELISCEANEFTLIGGSEMVLAAGGIAAPVKIIFQIPRHGGNIGVKLTTRNDSTNLTIADDDAKLRVYLTAKGNPEHVVTNLEVDLLELIEKRYLMIPYDDVIDIEIDIYARAYSPVAVLVESVSSISELINLPAGRFDDFAWFVKRDKPVPGLIAWVEDDLLKVALYENGGKKYDRHIGGEFHIVFCRNHDPDQFIARSVIDLGKLADNKISLHALPDGDFDIFTQLYTEQLSFLTKPPE